MQMLSVLIIDHAKNRDYLNLHLLRSARTSYDSKLLNSKFNHFKMRPVVSATTNYECRAPRIKITDSQSILNAFGKYILFLNLV